MEAEPYVYRGDWNDVIRVAEESLPIAWQIGETSVILFVSAWLGLAYLKVEARYEARRVIDRTLEYSQDGLEKLPRRSPLDLPHHRGLLLTRLAEGETEGPPLTRRGAPALDYAHRSRFRLEQGAAHRALGQAYAATGNRTEAGALAFLQSLAILEAIRSWPEVGQTLLAYGRFKRPDDPAESRALVERARVIFTEIGATGWLAEAEEALRA